MANLRRQWSLLSQPEWCCCAAWAACGCAVERAKTRSSRKAAEHREAIQTARRDRINGRAMPGQNHPRRLRPAGRRWADRESGLPWRFRRVSSSLLAWRPAVLPVASRGWRPARSRPNRRPPRRESATAAVRPTGDRAADRPSEEVEAVAVAVGAARAAAGCLADRPGRLTTVKTTTARRTTTVKRTMTTTERMTTVKTTTERTTIVARLPLEEISLEGSRHVRQIAIRIYAH